MRIAGIVFLLSASLIVSASMALPGTFDLAKMMRVTADLGKCPVCGVAKVEWIDEESGVMLCGRCYAREKAFVKAHGRRLTGSGT